MSNSNTIIVELREGAGKGASRRLRHSGKIPAILYGAGKDPVALTLDHTSVLHATENESFYSSILEIEVEDGRNQLGLGGDAGLSPDVHVPLVVLAFTAARHAFVAPALGNAKPAQRKG